ncbi:hypothetical protein [Paenarthrobacter sp. PH39-S1]|uniref:hypothetical protein n=1 Tax=Paenarthrobacter sp. PH39-S1 TaxID=3046204 RepID=UPI0024B8BD3A|nr:hypothetical protein [Paenarthrobacter sp. PH39-S1]MDJ0358597.1 hypothetical protein [Paenarthrobacter sp. PH39-S1]
MKNKRIKVIAGIDALAYTHRVALTTEHGKRPRDKKFLAVGSAHREIASYLTSFGPAIAAGTEGTGPCGAELTWVLAGQGSSIREANRAERRLPGRATPAREVRSLGRLPGCQIGTAQVLGLVAC